VKTPTLESIPSCKLVIDYEPLGIRREFDCPVSAEELCDTSYECDMAARGILALTDEDPLAVVLHRTADTATIRWHATGDLAEARALLLEIVGGSGREEVTL